MTKDELIEMLRASCDKDRVDPEQNGFWVIVTEELEAFAKLVEEKAIKEALAQSEQEPVAWMDKDGDVLSASVVNGKGLRNIPLYTTSQIEVGCGECGVGGGHALYCVECAEKFVGNIKG